MRRQDGGVPSHRPANPRRSALPWHRPGCLGCPGCLGQGAGSAKRPSACLAIGPPPRWRRSIGSATGSGRAARKDFIFWWAGQDRQDSQDTQDDGGVSLRARPLADAKPASLRARPLAGAKPASLRARPSAGAKPASLRARPLADAKPASLFLVRSAKQAHS